MEGGGKDLATSSATMPAIASPRPFTTSSPPPNPLQVHYHAYYYLPTTSYLT
jgi:hypothetical protein